MTRDDYDTLARVQDAEATRYDYENQAWVVDGRYVRCGHPDNMDCGCYGREHEGEEAS